MLTTTTRRGVKPVRRDGRIGAAATTRREPTCRCSPESWRLERRRTRARVGRRAAAPRCSTRHSRFTGTTSAGAIPSTQGSTSAVAFAFAWMQRRRARAPGPSPMSRIRREEARSLLAQRDCGGLAPPISSTLLRSHIPARLRVQVEPARHADLGLLDRVCQSITKEVRRPVRDVAVFVDLGSSAADPP
jgi:hypothetical protein